MLVVSLSVESKSAVWLKGAGTTALLSPSSLLGLLATTGTGTGNGGGAASFPFGSSVASASGADDGSFDAPSSSFAFFWTSSFFAELTDDSSVVCGGLVVEVPVAEGFNGDSTEDEVDPSNSSTYAEGALGGGGGGGAVASFVSSSFSLCSPSPSTAAVASAVVGCTASFSCRLRQVLSGTRCVE